jgi:hypothetical protein
VERLSTELPTHFILGQNYPNSFNPVATIKFTLAKGGFTTLKVFDLLGREVSSLVNGNLQAGVLHHATLNASKRASGMYFYRLESHRTSLVKKLVVTK